MRLLCSCYVFIALLCLPFYGLAESKATAKLSHFIQQVQTFQATFSQTVVDDMGGMIETAEGVFILNRPGQFRWDYQRPYQQHIVADGERIWFYDVDLEQVTVSPQSATLAHTPAALLSGEFVPEDVYVVTDLPAKDGLAWVALTPKSADAQFQKITLAFSGNELRQLTMKDNLGTQTTLIFSQTVTNQALADNIFIFSPPAGVDVIGESGL